jgi:hypothetical protein
MIAGKADEAGGKKGESRGIYNGEHTAGEVSSKVSQLSVIK